MPPRFVYWTIIFGGQPTSFRSATREELLPTFKQIQAKHPDAQLRYFARGKLWYSDEEARAALLRDRFEKSRPARNDRPPGDRPPGDRPRSDRPRGDRPRFDRPRDDRPRENRKPGGGGWKPKAGGGKRSPFAGGSRSGFGGPGPRRGDAARGRGWRPGGEHEDPRARFKVPRDVKRARMAKKFGWKKKKDDEK